MELYYILNVNYLGKKRLVEVSSSKKEIEDLMSILNADIQDTLTININYLVTEKQDSVLGLSSKDFKKLSTIKHFIGFVQSHPEIDAKRRELLYN